MCGIIGRIGLNGEFEKSLGALKELEYRGYDSFGILFSNPYENEFFLKKSIGSISEQKKKVIPEFESFIEIGHTRWATHGGISKDNAHPHFDSKKEFFVVMNGIVENYLGVKNFLVQNGYEFKSQTDTEVIAHLFAYFKEKSSSINLVLLLKKVLDVLEGEFSFLVKFEDKVLGYKNINPLIVGRDNQEFFISSDSNLVQKNSSEFLVLDDKEGFLASLSENEVEVNFFDSNYDFLNRKFLKSNASFENVLKETSTFMEKEILEQKFLKNLVDEENLKNVEILVSKLKSGERVVISAAGSSFYAGMFLHYKLLELGINSQVIVASELSNYVNCISDSLIVLFSQSGETADLIYPLKILEEKNEIFAVVNSKDSTLDRMAQNRVYLNCGKEVSVASTKAFSYQIFTTFLIERVFEGKSLDFFDEFESSFNEFWDKNFDKIDSIVEEFKDSSSLFFIGRGKFYPLALEGALKLKETSYIHAEGFAGGELKHGSLALIDESTGVVVLGNNPEIISNAVEVQTRGGKIIHFSCKKDEMMEKFKHSFKINCKFEELFYVVLMQVFALKMSLKKGFNPDKPRNLAKSVTVK